MRGGLLFFPLSVAVYGQQSRDLLREPVQTWHPFGDRGTRWAVVVGISSYQHLPPGAQYDDGGFGGGNMERPALRKLLEDIEAGQIDSVVVYKVDRLSRSLLDFARLMGVFEQHGVRFVSVTQQFNTTTPVGRLTLHIRCRSRSLSGRSSASGRGIRKRRPSARESGPAGMCRWATISIRAASSR